MDPPFFEHTWDDDDCEDGSTIRFSLTVHRGAATSSATKSLFVPGEKDLKAPPAQPLRSLRMTALLELPSSDVRGRRRYSWMESPFRPRSRPGSRSSCGSMQPQGRGKLRRRSSAAGVSRAACGSI
jgi:hypothetical protein